MKGLGKFGALLWALGFIAVVSCIDENHLNDISAKEKVKDKVTFKDSPKDKVTFQLADAVRRNVVLKELEDGQGPVWPDSPNGNSMNSDDKIVFKSDLFDETKHFDDKKKKDFKNKLDSKRDQLDPLNSKPIPPNGSKLSAFLPTTKNEQVDKFKPKKDPSKSKKDPSAVKFPSESSNKDSSSMKFATTDSSLLKDFSTAKSSFVDDSPKTTNGSVGEYQLGKHR